MNVGLPAKFFVDVNGNYIGAFSGVQPDDLVEDIDGEAVVVTPAPIYPDVPDGAVEVPYPPHHAADVWTENGYDTSRRPPAPSPLQRLAAAAGMTSSELAAALREAGAA